MRWSYDLVIIGDSLAAIQGAIGAANHSRVGLVIGTGSRWQWEAFNQSLEHLPASLASEQKRFWLLGHLQRCQDRYSQGALAQTGVDVISGVGSFQKIGRSQGLEFVIEADYLQAPVFILVDRPSSLQWNQTPQPPETLLTKLADAQPTSVYIPGQSLAELVWVKLCLQLGIQVSWGGDLQGLLPDEDPLVLAWLTTDLENAGVKVLDATTQNLCAPLDQFTQFRMVSDSISQSLSNLNLPEILATPNAIMVNSFLQTTQPQLYACGDWLGGYNLPMITQAEVQYLIQRLLSRQQPQPINYKTIPWWLDSSMSIARIGWQLQKAQNAFPAGVYSLPVQAENFGSGYGQIVLDRQHRLLGATLWGDSAIAAVKTLGLGMEHRSAQDCLGAAGWEIATHPRQMQFFRNQF